MKSPDEVFTPRSATVNEAMYVDRPELESALEDALSGHKHIIIHGESGTGKSWLYKRVFAKLGVTVLAANLGAASRFGSLTGEFKNLIDRRETAVKTGYEEKKKASVQVPLVAEGKLEHNAHYELGQKEPFEACLAMLRDIAGKGLACLVLDNLEAVFDNKAIMKELADVILLLDDERYAPYRVKIAIVGVPGDLRRYFSRIENLTTVANRLTEIPEVARLHLQQTKDLISRGLIGELEFEIEQEELNAIMAHVAWVTDRIPQHVQEYCLELARIGVRNNRKLSRDDLVLADKKWLSTSLYSDYSAIEAGMNSIETTRGRRNQTLYAIGTYDAEEFKWQDILETMRSEFPKTTEGIELSVRQMLADLEKKSIIRRSPKGDGYVFSNPKYRMSIRAMLRKTPGEQIEKVDIKLIV